MTNEQRQAYITGLLEERRAAEVNGKPDRVDAINAELALVGHEGATPAKRATKRPAATARKTEKR
jgi:hypothetical protein